MKKVGVFDDVTRSSGVKMEVRSDLPRLKLIATMIGGCAVGDFDGDGRPDLYVANSIPRWGKPNTSDCGRLYRNVGGGRFEDVTQKSGIRACGLGMGAYWADLDGDGRLDLYLTNVGPNAVWWNRGDGTFEQGKDYGSRGPPLFGRRGFSRLRRRRAARRRRRKLPGLDAGVGAFAGAVRAARSGGLHGAAVAPLPQRGRPPVPRRDRRGGALDPSGRYEDALSSRSTTTATAGRTSSSSTTASPTASSRTAAAASRR